MPTNHLARIPSKNALVQPVNLAQREQGKQSFVTALAEIEELKQTLRYTEIALSKSKEENDRLKADLKEEMDTS